MDRGPRQPYRFSLDELPPAIAEKVLRTEVFHFQDADYQYGVLDPSVAPIHFVVGMPNGQNLIASSAIPPELLPYYLGHEILCNRKRAGEDGRCAEIESGIIQKADKQILRALLQARRQTFEDLVRLYDINLSAPLTKFHKEIAGTTLLLRKKMEKLKIPWKAH